MTDLTKLTAKEFSKRIDNCDWDIEERLENERRLERLEGCEADSKILDWLERVVFNGDVSFWISPTRGNIGVAYRDEGTHSCVKTGNSLREAARAALEGK